VEVSKQESFIMAGTNLTRSCHSDI